MLDVEFGAPDHSVQSRRALFPQPYYLILQSNLPTPSRSYLCPGKQYHHLPSVLDSFFLIPTVKPSLGPSDLTTKVDHEGTHLVLDSQVQARHSLRLLQELPVSMLLRGIVIRCKSDPISA